MSKRSAARGMGAASSIRLTLRTSNAVATSNASPSRCFLFCEGSRAARSARTAAATVSIPPIPKAPPKRRSLRPHQPFRPQEFLMGGKGDRQRHSDLAVVLLAQLARVLAGHPDRMPALLRKAGVVDDPGLDRSAALDGRQGQLANLGEHHLIRPGGLANEVQKRLVLGGDA